MISIETTKSFYTFLAQKLGFVHNWLPKFQVSKFQMDFEKWTLGDLDKNRDGKMHEDNSCII